jgi:ABC-2 type transport system ATP-binding protein
MKSENAVAASSLSRSFGAVRAVESVDLSIPSGEIYGFLGPNGAGKSSVVRMLTTLLLPTSGSARVAGHDVVTEPTAVRLRIGASLTMALLALKGRVSRH